MTKNPWINELKQIFRSFKKRTVLRVKFEVGPDGIKILSAQSENTEFLSVIGNSEDCPLSKAYNEKFLDTYGRLTKKPYFNKVETKGKKNA